MHDVLVKKLSDFVVDSPRLNKLGVKALKSRFLSDNPVFGLLSKIQMERRMKLCQEKPEYVMIENTNACNLRCVHCPHRFMKRGIGFMNMALYKKIIDECVELGINRVDIHQFGEPLLDDLFVERVRYAKMKGIKFVTTNTNGLLLTEKLAKELIRNQIDQIVVSIDAATSQTYKKVRPPGRLKVVEKNVRELIKSRSRFGSKKPKVVVVFVGMPENINEVNLFTKKWEGVADSVRISYLHNWSGSVNKQSSGLHESRYRDPCRLLWTELIISWDGKVPLCCIDYENKVVLGDLNRQSIKEVWKGSLLAKIRKAHVERHFDQIPLCKDCSYRTSWWLSR